MKVFHHITCLSPRTTFWRVVASIILIGLMWVPLLRKTRVDLILMSNHKQPIKPYLTTLTLAAFSFLALVCPLVSNGQSNRFKNEVYNYSITFPKNWSISDGSGDSSKIKAANSSSSKRSSDYGEINVIVIKNTPARMLQHMMEEDIKMAKNTSKYFQLIRSQPTILNKANAFVVELVIALSDNQYARILNFGIARKGNLYFIRCFASEALYKKSGDQITASCASFKFDLK